MWRKERCENFFTLVIIIDLLLFFNLFYFTFYSASFLYVFPTLFLVFLLPLCPELVGIPERGSREGELGLDWIRLD